MTEETKEQIYLKTLLGKVRQSLSKVNESIQEKREEIDSLNNHMQEYKRDMDHLEKNAFRETIFNYTLQGEHSVDRRKRLFRLLDTPYFGRIDFKGKTQRTINRFMWGFTISRMMRPAKIWCTTGVPQSRVCSTILSWVKHITKQLTAKLKATF